MPQPQHDDDRHSEECEEEQAHLPPGATRCLNKKEMFKVTAGDHSSLKHICTVQLFIFAGWCKCKWERLTVARTQSLSLPYTPPHRTHRCPAAVAELPEFIPALRQTGLAGLTLLLHGMQLCLQLLTLHTNTHTRKTNANLIWQFKAGILRNPLFKLYSNSDNWNTFCAFFSKYKH